MGFWNDLKNAGPHKAHARGRELFAASISLIQKGNGLSPSELAKIGFTRCEVCYVTFGAAFSNNSYPCLIQVSIFDHLSFGEHLPAVFACNNCVKTFNLDAALQRTEAQVAAVHAEQEAERVAAERAAAERVAAERKSNKLPKASSKITDPFMLHCQKCDQFLNIPKGKRLRVSCPTCGHSWVHDGTAGKSESSNPPKDQVAKKVEKGDAEQVTDFADRPKSKLQSREEQVRQTPEKEADKTNPYNVTPSPTDVDYVEEESADVVRKINEEKRIAEEKRQACYSTAANKEHQAKLERREQRVSAEKGLKEEERQAEEERKAEKKKQDSEAWKNRWKKEEDEPAIDEANPPPSRTVSIRSCSNCNQPLYIRMGYKLNVCCPTCWHKWAHDGTTNEDRTDFTYPSSEPKAALENVPAGYARCPECTQVMNIDQREMKVTCPTCDYLWERGKRIN